MNNKANDMLDLLQKEIADFKKEIEPLLQQLKTLSTSDTPPDNNSHTHGKH